MDNKNKLTGTPNQIEWAEQIRLTVAKEFNRVAKVFQAQVSSQTGQQQAETRIIIAIVEQKRGETLSIPSAGYFIREWGEMNDQVRRMIAKDPRYHFIRDQRALRRRAAVNRLDRDVRTPEQLRAAREASLPAYPEMPSHAGRSEVGWS